MAYEHTALQALPDLLRKAGLHVIVADDWELGQGAYLWTDPHTEAQSYDQAPSGYMVHHTAGDSYPMRSHSLMPANALIGLDRGDDRLYQDGEGVPTVYLASAGPARISSGYGYRPAAWDYTFRDERAPVHAEGGDTGTALNRYVFNVETVHRGDGGLLDRGVWEAVVMLGVVLHGMFGWKERTLGHLSWTRRKIDPRWVVGLEHDGSDCIVDIQEAIMDAMNPPLPAPKAPNLDECRSHQEAAWQRAWLWQSSLINKYTHPQAMLSKGDLFVFLDRMGIFDTPKVEA